MNPVITIVGRPNVGKSTLFNRLTRSRDALVADFSGLTRDRHYGKGRIGERAFICVDTGGFEPVAKTGIVAEMAKQTKQAVAESDIVIFLVVGRLGLAPQDRVIADFLRKSGRPVILAVNKTEGMQAGGVTADFHELGLGEPFPISSAHGDGVRGLIDDALDYGGVASKLGKNTGDDFREGKITLPVVLSFRRGTEEERNFWRRTLEKGEIKDGDLETALATMRKHRALEDTVERAPG